jgi:hypothetical protein
MAAGQTKYRVILLLLAVAFIVVVVAAVMFAPSGTGGALPSTVQRLAPEDGAIVLRQARVVLHLDPGYRATFVIDGVPIPDDQVIFTAETGLHVFTPGPGLEVEEWSPGFHVVDVSWDRLSGLPDPGSMRWSFRVT